jgi:aromatic ring-cleaving dioxygenase
MADQSVENRGYHAHIYYDPKTKPVAERVCAALQAKFPVEFGGFRDEPVGPHPISNARVTFTPGEFHNIVPWLMMNHQGLDVLIHALTEDSVADHSSRALWLGKPVPMKLEVLRPQYSKELLPSEARGG